MTPREILDVIELVYYGPVVFIALYVCVKHGFNRSDGYLLLVILSLLRLIGASTGIAANNYPNNASLIVCSLICSNIGLSPLMFAVVGFQKRIISNCSPKSPIPSRFTLVIGLPLLAAMIVSIVGGSEVNSIQDLAAGSSYHTYTQAAAGVYIFSYVVLLLVVGVTTVNRYRAASTDQKLLWACVIVMPFLCVRLIYTCLISFDYHDQKDFSLYTDTSRAVAIQGVLAFGMEVIVVSTLLAAAILTPRNVARQGSMDPRPEDLEAKPNFTQRPGRQVNTYEGL